LRRNPTTIESQRFVIDSKVVTVRFITNNDTFAPTKRDSELCSKIPVDMKYTPVKIKLYHKSKETTRRKILHHDFEVKTTIETRRCVMWNPDMGLHGGWDATFCTTVMSEQDSTTCECSEFGTYALAAEKIEQPEGKEDFTWLQVSRYIGFCVSLLSLAIFIIIIAANRHLWEMFHLIRLNTGIAYFFALLFHFISEVPAIREDRHNNATFSSLILFFYLCGSYFQLMEAFAEFRAITGGIIGGKTIAYIPLGWGPGFIGLGVTWYLYGADVGTDPNVFIGWENETKIPFLSMNYFALGGALLLSAVVIFNASTPQTRKEGVVEDLQAQGQGLAITNFLFVMVWMFAYPAFIKFPGQEMRDFYPVFSIFNAWMGLIILIFLGFSSKRVRHVMTCKKKPPPKESSYAVDDSSPIVPLEIPPADSPLNSRPTSANTEEDSLDGDLPGAVDSDTDTDDLDVDDVSSIEDEDEDEDEDGDEDEDEDEDDDEEDEEEEDDEEEE